MNNYLHMQLHNQMNMHFKVKQFLKQYIIIDMGREKNMNFPEGTTFREEIDPDTGQKIKIAILPDGTELKFYTEENLENI